MTGMDSLLGRAGEPPKCRVVSDKIAVHWFPVGAVPGDACLCGATARDADEDVAIEAPDARAAGRFETEAELDGLL